MVNQLGEHAGLLVYKKGENIFDCISNKTNLTMFVVFSRGIRVLIAEGYPITLWFSEDFSLDFLQPAQHSKPAIPKLKSCPLSSTKWLLKRYPKEECRGNDECGCGTY